MSILPNATFIFLSDFSFLLTDHGGISTATTTLHYTAHNDRARAVSLLLHVWYVSIPAFPFNQEVRTLLVLLRFHAKNLLVLVLSVQRGGFKYHRDSEYGIQFPL